MNIIFSERKLKLHRNRAASYAIEYDFLYNYSAELIYSKLEDLLYSPQRIFELGARRGSLSRLLMNYYQGATIFTSEIAEQALQQNPAKIRLSLSDEVLCFKEPYFDLILSSLNIHWINDLPKFLQQIKNILSDQGTFIGTFIGGVSLRNLRANFIKAEMACGLPHAFHISPMIEHYTITALLQKIGFKNIVTETEIVEVEYQNILALMHDLKNMGESAAFYNAHNYLLGKQLLKSLIELYPEHFTEKFEIISFTASLA